MPRHIPETSRTKERSFSPYFVHTEPRNLESCAFSHTHTSLKDREYGVESAYGKIRILRIPDYVPLLSAHHASPTAAHSIQGCSPDRFHPIPSARGCGPRSDYVKTSPVPGRRQCLRFALLWIDPSCLVFLCMFLSMPLLCTNPFFCLP